MSYKKAESMFDNPGFVAQGEEFISLLSAAALSAGPYFDAWSAPDTKEYDEVCTFIGDHLRSTIVVKALSVTPYIIDESFLFMSGPLGVTGTEGKFTRRHMQAVTGDPDTGAPTFYLRHMPRLFVGPLNAVAGISAVTKAGQKQARIAIGA